MLRFPYTTYDRLHVYYLDRHDLPPVHDPDLIGTWIEDDTAILFFHQPKDAFIQSLCRDSGAEIVYQADLAYQDWEAGVAITSPAMFCSHSKRSRLISSGRMAMDSHASKAEI